MAVEDDADTQDLHLVFRGNAREYFRLWVVNLCLTLFTFGIFSAWAKVRKKRYFYAHTELAGTPFEYLAQPLPILKGRLLAALLFACWYMDTHFSPRLLLAVFGVGLVLLPWVLARTAAFNARYSAYRNITFHFGGSYWGVARTLVVAVLLTVPTFGLGYPWAYTLVRRYFVEHTSFGGVRARYSARGGHVASPFFLVAASVVCVAVLTMLMLRAGVSIDRVVTPVVAGNYAGYAVGYAYLAARLGNTNFQHSSCGPIGFEASYLARDFLWLYLTNALAILCSLGLLIPWATVRMYRYRIDRLSVFHSGPLEVFVGRRDTAVRAAGAEIADMFDFDLSL
jgi:uncharacterized membrane protein YjgN (DUF898 family)